MKQAFRRLIAAVIIAFVGLCTLQAAQPPLPPGEGTLRISSRVVESMAHRDLLNSKVIVTDSLGRLVTDTIKVVSNGLYSDGDGNWYERAFFSFDVPRHDAIYNIEVLMDEYSPYYYTLIVDKIGRREATRTIPDMVLTRAPRQLGEVTVTASKIKFYNRGDTIVFNADAFELAEGSMLDALVRQLPGVELKEGGRIYVNGEFVDNLLLNGQDFFNGNNELMLDNLASYTVKDIEVYRRASDFDRWAGREDQKQLVMDVKLKKEYNTGWMMNLEAGGGTSDRYLGRAFINRYTNYSRVSLIGNINNLNDNRKPGEATAWSPALNTTGTMKTQMVGVDYNAKTRDDNRKINGSLMVRHTSQRDRRDTESENFLNNNTRYWNYDYYRTRVRSLSLSTNHRGVINHRATYNQITLDGTYDRMTSDAASTGGSFRDEQPTMTQGMLDTIYGGDPTAIEELINRSRTVTRNSGHSASGSLSYDGGVKIPKTNDYLTFRAGLSISDSKHEVWRDYLINYGQDPAPAVRENQYFDDSPNRQIAMFAGAGYNFVLNTGLNLGLGYKLEHEDGHKDSYMYALDRLTENGIVGELPEGYLTTLDPDRSYRSHTVQNEHTISLSIRKWNYEEKFSFSISPTLRIIDRNFDYLRAGVNYHVDQRHTVLSIPDYSAQIYFRLGKFKRNGRNEFRHAFNLRVMSTPTIPDPVKMVNVTDTSDPLNIWAGNPDLKSSTDYKGILYWYFRTVVAGYSLNSTVNVSYSNNRDALVNGYSFDESTGIRYLKTFNVRSGNYTAKIHAYPSLQFGSKGQFSASYFGGLDYLHYADMIGTGGKMPEPSSVHTWWQVHTLRFSWQIGKQQLGFMGQINNRYTDSDRQGFSSINASNNTLQMTGQFKLPKGFGISTDFSVYMRRGYGSGLDTTDPVWNARVTYTPPKSRWTFMLDGFDLLHQLSNVSYAVNAQGRTITYTNVLPRYLLLHVQYKVNILPKKKIIDTRAVFY